MSLLGGTLSKSYQDKHVGFLMTDLSVVSWSDIPIYAQNLLMLQHQTFIVHIIFGSFAKELLDWVNVVKWE